MDEGREAPDEPARGTMEDRVAEIRGRLSGVTTGPWFVWDGHGYFGGGRDLCIGAGPTWLANMGHRSCSNDAGHNEALQRRNEAETYIKYPHAFECAPEPDSDILQLAETCTLDEQFTDEQIANANFIARAREDVPFLLDVIALQDKQIEELHAEIHRLRYPNFKDDTPEPSHVV